MLSTSFAGSGDDGLVDVPNLVGKTMQQAESMEGIEGVFTLEIIGSRQSTEYEAGKIIEQDPGVGARKAPGTVIQVFLSLGYGSKEMPYLLVGNIQHQILGKTSEACADKGKRDAARV